MTAQAYPIVRFCAGPSPTSAVRYDLQAGSASVLRSGFSFGAPQLAGDPETVSRKWGYRQLKVVQMVDDVKAVAYPLVTRLARELLQDRNWLMVQMSATSKPLWFRTWLTQPEEISFENVYNEELRRDQWEISATIDADPWIYGAREILPTVTINNDPTAGTNPCLYVLPAIKGDAPAPLRIRHKALVAANRKSALMMVSCMGSALAPTGQLLATTASLGTDTAAGSSDALMIGSDYSRISFATVATMATRIVYSGPTLVHGTYKVMARIRTNTSTGSFQLQLVNQDTPNKILGATATVTVTTALQWVDLGVIDWPPGGRIEDDFLQTSSTLTMALQAARVSSTASLDIDAVVLVPIGMDDADADTAMITLPTSETSPDAAYIDGDTKSVRLVTSGDVPLQATTPAAVAGQFPYGIPGVTNVLRYFQTINTTRSGGDAVGTTATVDISYSPQWLWLADS